MLSAEQLAKAIDLIKAGIPAAKIIVAITPTPLDDTAIAQAEFVIDWLISIRNNPNYLTVVGWVTRILSRITSAEAAVETLPEGVTYSSELHDALLNWGAGFPADNTPLVADE